LRIDLGWFSFKSFETTGPFLEGSCVPFTTHCKRGLAFDTPKNAGVMSSMAWLTRLSAKAHFSVPQCRDLESDSLESDGEGKLATG
jgi:hypothetical protein